MESIDAAEASLRAIEQGSVKAWTQYPPTPFYYYAGLGAAEGVLSTISPLGKIHPALAVAAGIAAAMGLGAVIGAYRKLRGQTPVRGMPVELRRLVAIAIGVFVAAYGGLIALSFTPLWPGNPVLGGVLAIVGGSVYERHYRKAADAAERRVGLR